MNPVQFVSRMCEFHTKASEFLARRSRLFVGSPRTGEVRRKTVNRPYKYFSKDQLCLSGFCYHCSTNVVFLCTCQKVTISVKDPEFRPITPLVKMVLRKRYRLRRKGRVDAANVVAQ